MDDITASAPAQDPTPAPVQSAVQAAVASDSTSAYREAKRAERAGKPLPDVPVASDAAPEPSATPTGTPAVAPQPVISKRQQETNDRIRVATEKAVADATRDAHAEIARLRALQPQAAPVPAPTEPKPAAIPEWKRIAAMPDAPKLADFDSIEEHAAAMGIFVAEQRDHARQATSDAESLTAAQRARVDGFVGRIQEARANDPEFVNKISPEVKALKPFGALMPGEPAGPRNVVAEQIYDSPISNKVLLHFSAHPEALKKFETLPPHIAALPPSVRVKAHIQWIVREFGKLEASLETPSAPAPVARPQAKTLTDAAEPAQTLGGRPAEAADPLAGAIRRGSTSDYRRLKREQRAAMHR